MSLYAVIKQLEGVLGGTQAEAVIEYVRVSAQEHSIDMVSRIDEKIAARYAHVDKRMAETATQIELRFAERLDKSLAEVRREMTEGLAAVRQEMKDETTAIRAGIADARKETADFRVEVAQALAAAESKIFRWIVTSIVIASTFLVAVSIALRLSIS